MFEREIVGKRPTFRQNKPRLNFYRIMLWLSLILAGVWFLLSFQRGEVKTPFQPTPTPTRMAQSFMLEAQAYFDAGKLDDPSNNLAITPTPAGIEGSQQVSLEETEQATPTPVPAINDSIEAYQAALDLDPGNAKAWAELARIQAYSTNMLRNDTERLQRLDEAVASVQKAIELAPDDSTTIAIYAFVLDWYAFNPLVSAEQSQELLAQANNEAVRAYQLDPENALALAYYAEILVDQQRWEQARQYALEAVRRDNLSMDTHRVLGFVYESRGEYNNAIKEYQEAAAINPNLTFLYIRIGQNFREGIKNPERALEYFERAAKINEQLGVQNPIPYIEIAKTYTQQGQFFAASLNAEKALSLDPFNAHTYGQLGIIFIRARNYEGAMPLLKCAVRGCTAEENEMGQVAVQGLPMSSLTVAYYYVEYGTVMAFLSRATENYCPEAIPVLNEVRLARPDDPILMGIVQDSEGICRRLDGGSVPQPSETPEPETTATPEM